MSITRVLLCLFLPPLAVIDKGCGVVLLVCVLTICGWIPGALAALIICVQQPQTSQQQLLTPRQPPKTSLDIMALAAFCILGIGLYVSSHKSADETAMNASSAKNPSSLPASLPLLAASPSSSPRILAAPASPSQASHAPATGEAQREAIRRFPALGIAGSKFNTEFLARYRRYQSERPSFFRDGFWPVRLAEEVSKTVGPSQLAPEKVSDATPARTGRKITVGGYFASPSEELFDKAMTYTVQRDEVALSRLMATGLVIPLKADMPVETTDARIFSGKVKIRPRGQTIELWTVYEAVKDE